MKKCHFPIASALLTLAGCAGLPPMEAGNSVQCLGSQVRGAGGSALVGLDYGPQLQPIPLNSVLWNDGVVAQRVAVQSLSARRTQTDTVRVSARLANCGSEAVSIRARTHFLEQDQVAAEMPSAWRTLVLPAQSLANYTESSLQQQGVKSYIVELAWDR